MKKTLKKHLKGVFLAILGLITGILCIVLGIKIFKFFLPFIIGWFLAMIASPLVEFLEKKLKISRKHTSMVIIIMVLGAIIGGSYLIGAKVMTETGKFLEQAPNLYSGFSESMNYRNWQSGKKNFRIMCRRVSIIRRKNWERKLVR